MNPAKCVFGVSSGKSLGLIVSNRGIELDPTKAKAIREMPPPTNVREVRDLIGRLQFIRRFISQHTKKCQPFYELLKVGKKFEWTPQCQEAFDAIKTYMLDPPGLSPPILSHPLLLYVSTTCAAIGAMIAQHDEDGKK